MSVPYRRIGRVLKPHGTHGEVSVALRDDLPDARLVGLRVWLVPPGPRGAIAHIISDVRHGPRSAIVRLDGDRTAEDAGAHAGRWLLAHEDDVPAPAEEGGGSIGMTVIDADRGMIGVVADVIVTGANDVLVVEGGPYGQVLVPVIDDVIAEVDLDAGTIAVTLLPGLIDEERL